MNIKNILKSIKIITKTKTNYSILSKVLIENGKLYVTDLEEYLTVQLTAFDTIENGLYRYESIEDFLLKNIPAKLFNSNYEDFPETIKIEGSFASFNFQLLKNVSKTISTDNTKYTLNAVYFDKENLVSLDGRRMTLIPHLTKITEPFMVSSRVLKHLTLFDYCEVSINPDKYVVFNNEEITLAVSKNTGRFPKYQMFIPEQTEKEIQCEVNDLLESLSLLKNYLNPESNKLLFTLENDHLFIGANNSETPTNDYKIKIKTNTKEKVTFGLNHKLFQELLNDQKNETVKISFNNPQSPLALTYNKKEEGFLQIIMPMKLDGITFQPEQAILIETVKKAKRVSRVDILKKENEELKATINSLKQQLQKIA